MKGTMQRKTFPTDREAITDQGVFRALVSTGSEDREGDVVKRGAFAKTIAQWRESGKKLPLAWDHSTEPQDIFGVIDPEQMEETAAGLVVGGEVDLESPRGPEAWRVMKSGAMGFSFGYLAKHLRPNGKGNDILAVDLFEVSGTIVPMNADSKVLSMKSATSLLDWPVVPPDAAIRERAAILAKKNSALPNWKGPDCPPDFVGTAWDPTITGQPFRLADLPLAELKAYGERLTKDIDTRPIRVAVWEID